MGFPRGRGGGRGNFRGGGGRGRGRGGGSYYDAGPPEKVVEIGHFLHPCENDLVCKCTNASVPYFNAPIYLENKSQIGKVDEIFGPMTDFIKLSENMYASSFKSTQKFYIDPYKLLPLSRFLPGSRGSGGRGGGRGRTPRGGTPRGGTPRGGRGGRGSTPRGGGRGFGRGGQGFSRGRGRGFGRGR